MSENDPLFVTARRVKNEPALQKVWNNGLEVHVDTTHNFRRARVILFAGRTVAVTHYGSIIVPIDPTLSPERAHWRHVSTKEDLEQSIDHVAKFNDELNYLLKGIG